MAVGQLQSKLSQLRVLFYKVAVQVAVRVVLNCASGCEKSVSTAGCEQEVALMMALG